MPRVLKFLERPLLLGVDPVDALKAGDGHVLDALLERVKGPVLRLLLGLRPRLGHLLSPGLVFRSSHLLYRRSPGSQLLRDAVGLLGKLRGDLIACPKAKRVCQALKVAGLRLDKAEDTARGVTQFLVSVALELFKGRLGLRLKCSDLLPSGIPDGTRLDARDLGGEAVGRLAQFVPKVANSLLSLSKSIDKRDNPEAKSNGNDELREGGTDRRY